MMTNSRTELISGFRTFEKQRVQMRYILVISSVVILCGISASPSLAGWGCHATGSNKAIGADWGKPTEEAARSLALELCSRLGKNCRAVCQDNLDTQDQFEAIWPRPAAIKNCNGDAKGC
jgi:hypothetical protein